GFRNTQEKWDRDLDATQVDFYSMSSDQDYEQVSQEISLSEQLSEKLYYSTGIYYLSSKYSLFQEEFFILNALGNAGLGDAHNALDVQQLTSNSESTTYSFFAHVEYVLDDQWTLDLGTRLSSIEKDFRHSPSGIRSGNTITPSPTIITDSNDWDKWSYSGGASYKVDPQAMVYFRYSQGFTPGGFSENAVSADSAKSYDSETNTNWELGMKSEWFNDKLRLNLAYFENELDSKHEQFIAPVSSGRLESIIDNVASIETNGYELEFEAVPIENLYLRGSYSHMNADYEKYIVPDPATPGAEFHLEGLAPNRAPSDTYFVSALYSFDFASGIVNTYAAYRYVNDYQTNSHIQVAKIANYTTWDLSVDYTWREWKFRFFSQNVRNKRYIQNSANLVDADVVPIVSGATNASGLVTFTEFNRPRYSGFEVVYTPDLSNVFGSWKGFLLQK
ncbi:MAG: hypothetical protein CMQ20_13955, partial [Gammaproteobacteria bacterium]|nr:hypothetical protein [Gammaproteobacteria bacterium]